jgi:hypothetical protein
MTYADKQALFDKLSANGKYSFQKSCQPGTKAYYEATIRRVTNPEGEVIKTKENPDPGVLVPFDGWVVEREEGDTYPISDKTKEERWQPVAGKEGIFSPKPVPTAMVELTEEVDILTDWGPMHGKAGDMLARYKEDNFAIVDRTVLGQTYEGVDELSQQKIQAIRD